MSPAEAATTSGRLLIVAALALAAAATVLVPPAGLSLTKGLGVALALVAFVPVFVALKRSFRSNSAPKLLKTFVGGFIFKLVVISGGVYAAFKTALPVLPFVASCLAFLMALQVGEAVYFGTRRDE